jgi:hypothetical protein
VVISGWLSVTGVYCDPRMDVGFCSPRLQTRGFLPIGNQTLASEEASYKIALGEFQTGIGVPLLRAEAQSTAAK